MKTARVSLEVEVPVVVCARCGKEAPCRPQLQPVPEGPVLLQVVPPFSPMRVGRDTVLICPECESFVRGAVAAMGIELTVEPR